MAILCGSWFEENPLDPMLMTRQFTNAIALQSK